MKPGTKVKLHYTGTLEDGTVFDSSENREPLEFTYGEDKVIKRFEDGVSNMQVNDEKTIKIAPKDSYGESNPDLTKDIPRESFPENMKLDKGGKLILKSPSGQHSRLLSLILTIKK